MWTSATPGQNNWFEYNAGLANQRTFVRRYGNNKRIRWLKKFGGCMIFSGGDDPKVTPKFCDIYRTGICAKGDIDRIESNDKSLDEYRII